MGEAEKNNIDLFSVFERTYKNGEQWITDLVFYKGDLSCVDAENDWRFKEVFGKRKKLKFLGLCQTSFPIQYPLKLSNGVELNDVTFKETV